MRTLIAIASFASELVRPIARHFGGTIGCLLGGDISPASESPRNGLRGPRKRPLSSAPKRRVRLPLQSPHRACLLSGPPALGAGTYINQQRHSAGVHRGNRASVPDFSDIHAVLCREKRGKKRVIARDRSWGRYICLSRAVPTSRLSGSFIRTRIRLRSSYSPAFHEHPAQHVAHLRTSCALPRTFCASEWTPQRTPFTVR